MTKSRASAIVYNSKSLKPTPPWRRLIIEKLVLKKIKLGLVFVLFTLMHLSCIKKDLQQTEQTESPTFEALNKESKNEIYNIYADYILFANPLINKLKEYHSQNGTYPLATSGFTDDLEQEITTQSGKLFYYTWLDSHYVLTYEMAYGTGLIYLSEDQYWTLTDSLP